MDAFVCPLCRIALTDVAGVATEVCPRDGHRGLPVSLWPAPSGLGERFRVLSPFAHGDAGSLYLADEPETGRRGLLKILAPASRDALPERQRLRRDLIKQSTLARSHLVVPQASGETDGVTWLFREWLDGVSLEVRLSREGALPQAEALAITAQVASALDELHRGGLLHRDVKPGHIFLQPSSQGLPRALLLDAGLVAPLVDRTPEREQPILDSAGQAVFGTAGYVAPEVLLGKLISFRSDLYSLGGVLYRMLTGRPAFGGESVASRLSAQRYGELPSLPSDLPNGIGALLRSILSKDPQQRPFSAQKLRRTLDPYLPDGALMEKQQTTSTYEAVPQDVQAAPGAGLPVPSGTLRPPPPPTPSSRAEPRASTRTSIPPSRSTPPAPPSGRTMPPPVPVPPRANVPGARSARPGEERTQQIDIGQIEEVHRMRKPISSVPPPTPSTPPAARLTDKTQPIRLDQILQVADARKAAGLLPPARPEPEPPPAPASEPAVLETPASSAAHESPLFTSTNPGIAGLPKQEPARAEAQPLFAQSDEPLATPTPASAPLFAQPVAQPAPPASSARPPMKATLMGMGDKQQNSLDLTLERSDAEATLERSAAEATLERSHTDEPRIAAAQALATQGPAQRALEPVDSVRAAAAPDEDVSRDAPLSAGLLGTVRTRVLENRRGMMYAGAAVVGLGLLSVLTSALFSDDAPIAAQQPAVVPALPAAQEPAAAREAPATAAAPAVAPTLAPAAPTTVAQAPKPVDEPSRAEPASSPVTPEKPREQVSAKATRERESSSKRETTASSGKGKRDDHATKKSAKTTDSEKGADKTALFNAAREEARGFYAAKNYKASAAAYERAAKLDPTHAGTFAGLGAARLQLGENKAAVAAYSRAVQLSPEMSGFHAALGRAYLANGERGKAIASYKKALQIEPRNETAKAALSQLGG